MKTLIVIILIVVVCIAAIIIGCKMLAGKNPGGEQTGSHSGKTPKVEGTTDAEALKLIEGIQGQYERGEGPRYYIDGTRIYEYYDGNYYIDTVITEAHNEGDNGERIVLTLADTTVTQGNTKSDIIDCYVEDKILHLLVNYSFGERDLEYSWTDKDEFYYYDIVSDEYLPEIAGTWSDGFNEFVIQKKGKLIFYFEGKKYGDPIDICVVRENTSPNGRIIVTNKNLHLSGIGEFTELTYKDGTLSGYQMVLDEDSNPIHIFEKIK